MLLIVGLGNPGRGYADHRHNVGFMVLDELARRTDAPPWRSKFSGELARANYRGQELVLLKPMTYMNLSGDCVQPCAAFFKITASDTLVIHDELDVPYAELRLKKGGGHAGHNGLRSIIGRLGADFGRLRCGIGRPPASFRGPVADYVLSPFSSDEREALPKFIEVGSKSVLDIAARGFAAAMKTRNTRPKQKAAGQRIKTQKRPKPPEQSPQTSTEAQPSAEAQQAKPSAKPENPTSRSSIEGATDREENL